MSLDAIKHSIMSEAEEKASAIESDATKESHRIVKEAQDRAEQILKNAESDAKKEAERLNKEAQAGAETEASAMILEAKGEAVERSVKKILADVSDELSNEGMEDILKQSIKQFKEISGGSFSIKTNKKNQKLLEKTAYEVEYGDIDGFMLYSDHGKVALNATVDSIVQHQADSARKMAYDEMFAGSQTRYTPKAAISAKPKKEKKAKKTTGKKKR